MQQRITAALLTTALALTVAPDLRAGEPAADGARTLQLIRRWVHGRYDNQAQFDSDIANNVPDNAVHRVMHQLFFPVPVKVPGLAGYLVFQQSSVNGSEDPATIIRAGILQFVPDAATGQLRQRELNFRDLAPWKNAHRHPEILRRATIADFNVNTGCDFWLTAARDEREIRGEMRGTACRIWSPGIRQELIADDAVVIRPDQYAFRGRFVDVNGKVRWGTESSELNTLLRVSGP